MRTYIYFPRIGTENKKNKRQVYYDAADELTSADEIARHVFGIVPIAPYRRVIPSRILPLRVNILDAFPPGITHTVFELYKPAFTVDAGKTEFSNPWAAFPFKPLTNKLIDAPLLVHLITEHYLKTLFGGKYTAPDPNFLVKYAASADVMTMIPAASADLVLLRLTPDQRKFMKRIINVITAHFAKKTTPIVITLINAQNERVKNYRVTALTAEQVKTDLFRTMTAPEKVDQYMDILRDDNLEFFVDFAVAYYDSDADLALKTFASLTSPLKKPKPRRRGGWINLKLNRTNITRNFVDNNTTTESEEIVDDTTAVTSFFRFASSHLGINSKTACCFVRSLLKSSNAKTMLTPAHFEFMRQFHSSDLLNIKFTEISTFVNEDKLPPVAIHHTVAAVGTSHTETDIIYFPPGKAEYIHIGYIENHYFPIITSTRHNLDVIFPGGIMKKYESVKTKNSIKTSSKYIMKKLILMRDDPDNDFVSKWPDGELLQRFSNATHLEPIESLIGKLYTFNEKKEGSLLPANPKIFRTHGFRREAFREITRGEKQKEKTKERKIYFFSSDGNHDITLRSWEKSGMEDPRFLWKIDKTHAGSISACFTEFVEFNTRKGESIYMIGFSIAKTIWRIIAGGAITEFGSLYAGENRFINGTFLYPRNVKVSFIDLSNYFSVGSSLSAVCRKLSLPPPDVLDDEVDRIWRISERLNAYFSQSVSPPTSDEYAPFAFYHYPTISSIAYNLAVRAGVFDNVYSEESFVYTRVRKKFCVGGRVVCNPELYNQNVKYDILDFTSLYPAAIVKILKGFPVGVPYPFYSQTEFRDLHLRGSRLSVFEAKVIASKEQIAQATQRAKASFPLLYLLKIDDDEKREWTNDLSMSDTFCFDSFTFAFYVLNILTDEEALSREEAMQMELSLYNSDDEQRKREVERYIIETAAGFFEVTEGIAYTANNLNMNISNHITRMFTERYATLSSDSEMAALMAKNSCTHVIGKLAVRTQPTQTNVISASRLRQKLASGSNEIISWRAANDDDDTSSSFVKVTQRNRFPRNAAANSIFQALVYGAARVLVNRAVYYGDLEPIYSDTDSLWVPRGCVKNAYLSSIICYSDDGVYYNRDILGNLHSDISPSTAVYADKICLLKGKAYAVLQSDGVEKFCLNNVEKDLIEHTAKAKYAFTTVWEFYDAILSVEKEYTFKRPTGGTIEWKL